MHEEKFLVSILLVSIFWHFYAILYIDILILSNIIISVC